MKLWPMKKKLYIKIISGITKYVKVVTMEWVKSVLGAPETGNEINSAETVSTVSR